MDIHSADWLESNGEAKGSTIYTNGFHVPHTVCVMTSHWQKLLRGRVLGTVFSRWENWCSQQVSSFPTLTQLLRGRPGTAAEFFVDIIPDFYKREMPEACNPAGEISGHILFCYLTMAPLALAQAEVGHSVSASGVRESCLVWSEKKLMNRPGSHWPSMVFTPAQGEEKSKKGPPTHSPTTHTQVKLKSLWICSLVVSQHMHFSLKIFDDTISTYNPYFSPFQAAKHSGQGKLSKIASHQIVPWGWILVFKTGNC